MLQHVNKTRPRYHNTITQRSGGNTETKNTRSTMDYRKLLFFGYDQWNRKVLWVDDIETKYDSMKNYYQYVLIFTVAKNCAIRKRKNIELLK